LKLPEQYYRILFSGGRKFYPRISASASTGPKQRPGTARRFFSICCRQLASYFFCGPRSHNRAKAFLRSAANRASPGIREVFELDSLGDFPLPVAFVRVVNIAAVNGLALPDIFRISHTVAPNGAANAGLEVLELFGRISAAPMLGENCFAIAPRERVRRGD
jgi:hypothetical protein